MGARPAMVETPTEILAKKVFYRAADFTARDVFDLAFLIEAGEAEGLMADARMYVPKLEVVLRRIETAGSDLERAFRAVRAEDYRPDFRHCAEVIRAFAERHRVTRRS